MTKFLFKGRRVVAALAASLVIAAAPAKADVIDVSDASTGAAVAASTMLDEDASPIVIGDGDAEYRQLYAEWQASEKTAPSPVRRSLVAVPLGMPLADARLTSSYGMRDHPVLRKRMGHKGVDLAAPTGTPIYATADGVVEMAQRYSSYGLYVQINHGGELETRFAHMSSMAVRPGERVKKGQIIGYVGSTGRSTGPHLHYEVRLAGEAVNPIPYMTAAVDPRLETGEGGRGGPE